MMESDKREWRIPKCPIHPDKRALRNEEHDSYYCEACDGWLEQRCSDLRCEFCASRPEKPSLVPKG